MKKLRKTRLIRYTILMIILVVSLLAFRISLSSYSEIETYKEALKEYQKLDTVSYTI
ncbi:MAG: hypothetical protein J6M60_03305 [Clostridia bacterium]|nr:hypothetical protein [Clostridia bacterium]